MICTCGKKMRPAKLSLHGFQVDGYKCGCGEETFDPRDVEKIRQAVNGKVKARTVANSLVITLPRPLAEIAKIKAGDPLHWDFSKNALTLSKA